MKKIITFLIAPFLLNLVACDKFLDKNPDSRVELDTAEKVQKFLVSAYPSVSPAVLTEFSSDNIDDIGANNRYNFFYKRQSVSVIRPYIIYIIRRKLSKYSWRDTRISTH